MNKLAFYLVMGLALLYTIISHEIAHGWVAYWNGDATARDSGRLRLNPIAHIDPLGLLCLIFFKFGWAKPVPINPLRFRHRRLGLFTTSIAGVSVNFISAFIALFCLIQFNVQPDSLPYLFLTFVYEYGISFGVFNLIPLPPLDGSKCIISLLPEKLALAFASLEKYTRFLLIPILLTGVLSNTLIRARLFVMDFMLKLLVLLLG